jgi:NADPH:quinone reductase-like Zn-dependent oxidoreductase
MKAAVLHALGDAPKFEDFPDPTPGDGELLVRVKAVPLENIDNMTAAGSHFASQQFFPQLPAIVGFDGIGQLDDGRVVGCAGMRPPYGAMAEWAVVPNTHTVPVPGGIDAVTAAALPGPTLTALFPLKWAAQLQPGETVLVNGATGFAGRLAVQAAKLLGAGRVVGTGRHDASLQSLRDLGADAVVDLKLPDALVAEAFAREAGEGYDIVLDFLWGHPTELLIGTLVPRELAFAKRRVRLVQIGEMAGPTIALSADALRTSGLEICGAGAGITPEAIAEATEQAWAWLRAGSLRAEIVQVPLKGIEAAWQRADLHGKRLVIVP